ncbi:MAG: Rrf2 family transcriptional regulator [Niameybacter sp.]|uniref:RrF2 family transcriptional regulator n=1 Tax=Niameybacter sp. TaxID=2033640 RepID=UPI002FCA67A8
MQLSKFTDYTFRVLIYMATYQDELYTVEKLATKLEVSEHHLKKVIHKLAKTDYLVSIKGRTGGLKLGLRPEEINLGEVLRIAEDNLCIVECIKNEMNCNFMTKECRLKGIIQESLEQFIEVFSRYTLQDIL